MQHKEPEDFRYGTPEDAQDNLGLGLVDDVAEDRTSRRTAPVKKWMLVAGAGLVVLIGIIALVAALMPRNIVSEVDGASDATEKTIEVTGGGNATLRVSPSLDEGSVTLADLGGAPKGQIYQVWVEATGGATASSLEVLDPGATKAAVGFKSLGDIEAVLVTTEPEGGSTEPSDTTVAHLDLP